MPKFGESLTKISLKEILSDQELEDLKKYNQFKKASEKGYNYEKDELILKLITLVIEKFISMKENTLVKCFRWVKKIIQENLEIKVDSSTFKNLEKMKEAKPNLKMKLGWMEEYSLFQILTILDLKYFFSQTHSFSYYLYHSLSNIFAKFFELIYIFLLPYSIRSIPPSNLISFLN